MGQIKVRTTRMYFDGEKRVREGEVLMLDEKELNKDCHERLDGKSNKKEEVIFKKEKKALPGQGPVVKKGATKKDVIVDDTGMADEDSPI